MKHLILTVLALLLGYSVWAQASGKRAACNMRITHAVTAPSCYNGMDGRVSLQVSGAKKPYNVQWSDDVSGETRNGLPAGSYTVTVRDADGCVTKHEVKLPQGQALDGDLTIRQTGVAGGAKKLTVLFANGAKPFAVNIKNLSKGARAPWNQYKGEALSSGVYLVEAFTNAGCSQVGRIDLRIQ
ncbi:SprB repeat-containing protein [Cesiribacter sp. SM1]|uniref:SprB repeat-containing protein n=1 Tax=Cesiribacter sp. SM1 TaxID=2861196 RepID=UPI001CD4317D|nr:SprB repeat-containing protein [Cesiribacter sp. SM1]